jgi:hypothetical protein
MIAAKLISLTARVETLEQQTLGPVEAAAISQREMAAAQTHDFTI